MPQDVGIFMSHASADLARVREIRNHLEALDLAPILFPLRTLADPDAFWPAIAHDMAGRNFFLYCDSLSAQASPWVQRERETVAALGQLHPRRIGRIRVDGTAIDWRRLDDFVARTQVFPCFAAGDRDRVAPFLAALDRAGFRVHANAATGGAGAADGWALHFLSPELASDLAPEVVTGAASGWVVPVQLEAGRPATGHDPATLFDAAGDAAQAATRLVHDLLGRR